MFQKILLCLWCCVGLSGVLYAAQPTTVTQRAEALDKMAAVVNDDVITENELAMQMAHIKSNMQQANIAVPTDTILRQQVLDQMINQMVQLQYAQKAGITVTPQEADEALQHIAVQNNTTVAQMSQTMQTQGWTEAQFKEEITKEVTVQKLQSQEVASHISIGQQEVDDFIQTAGDSPDNLPQYHVLDLLIPFSDTPTPAEINEVRGMAENLMKQLQQGVALTQIINTPLADHKTVQQNDLGWRKLPEFPTGFADKVQTMSVNGIAGPIQEPNGFHVIKLLDKQGGSLQHEEKVELRVLMVPHSVRHEEEAAIVQKMNQWRVAIENGASFSQLAKKYSHDNKTAVVGGYLGWESVDKLEVPIKNAVRTLKVGDVSEPTSMPDGWYLIQVVSRHQALLSDEAKRKEIEELIFQRKLEEGLIAFVNQLRSQAYIKKF